MSVMASHWMTTQAGSRLRTRRPDLLAESARVARRTAGSPPVDEHARDLGGRVEIVDAVPPLGVVGAAEYGAVRPQTAISS